MIYKHAETVGLQDKVIVERFGIHQYCEVLERADPDAETVRLKLRVVGVGDTFFEHYASDELIPMYEATLPWGYVWKS